VLPPNLNDFQTSSLPRNFRSGSKAPNSTPEQKLKTNTSDDSYSSLTDETPKAKPRTSLPSHHHQHHHHEILNVESSVTHRKIYPVEAEESVADAEENEAPMKYLVSSSSSARHEPKQQPHQQQHHSRAVDALHIKASAVPTNLSQLARMTIAAQSSDSSVSSSPASGRSQGRPKPLGAAILQMSVAKTAKGTDYVAHRHSSTSGHSTPEITVPSE
jgi:hypothetical protein